VIRRGARMKRNRLADEGRRLCGLAGLKRDHPQKVQAVGILRIDDQGLAIKLLGLIQTASLMVLERFANLGLRRRRGRRAHGMILSGCG